MFLDVGEVKSTVCEEWKESLSEDPHKQRVFYINGMVSVSANHLDYMSLAIAMIGDYSAVLKSLENIFVILIEEVCCFKLF